MKKLFILLLILAVFLAGCQSTQEQGTINENNEPIAQEQQSEQKEQKSRLEMLKQAFKDAGFEVGENELLAYEMLHAKNGMKFTLDGEPIEIYEYDMDNLSDEAREIVEQAKQGSINFSGFNIPVKFKDGLMLIRFDEHSQGEKIVEIFNSF